MNKFNKINKKLTNIKDPLDVTEKIEKGISLYYDKVTSELEANMDTLKSIETLSNSDSKKEDLTNSETK